MPAVGLTVNPAPPLGSQAARQVSTRPVINPFTPAIPQPAQDATNLIACVAALKSNVESLNGQRGDASNRAVTFRDLVDFGVIDPSALQSKHGQVDFTGPAGPAGPPGQQGEQGPVGPASTVPGPAGPPGVQGPPGTSVQIDGSVPTHADLPTHLGPADAGTGYITEDTGHLWVWDGTKWTDAGEIVGPAGPPGSQGPPGEQGEQGEAGPPGPAGDSSTVTIGSTPPLDPKPGDLFWDDSDGIGQLFVFFADADSSQWVIANSGLAGPTGPPGGQGIQGPVGPAGTYGSVISDTPPPSPSPGQTWWDSTTGQLYIFYVDPSGPPGQWIAASQQGPQGPQGIQGVPGPNTMPMGITNGSNAAAGMVGEFLTATNNASSCPNNSWLGIIQLALTPGDWDVWGYCNYNPAGGPLGDLYYGIGTTISAQPAYYDCLNISLTSGISSYASHITTQRFNVTVTTNVYLNMYCQWGTGVTGCPVNASIFARRMR